MQNYEELKGLVIVMKDNVFLHDALDLVVESRRAITMTYALAYYMEISTVAKEIFEMNQSDLWHHLDTLDELTDKCGTVDELRIALVDEVGMSKKILLSSVL